MRILGWMHRKLLRQNIIAADPPKDFTIGPDPLVQTKPALTRTIHKAHYYLNAFPRLEECEEDEPDIFRHWHHDFLSIGTLGTDPAGLELVQDSEPDEPAEKEAPQDAFNALSSIEAPRDALINALSPISLVVRDENAKDGQIREGHVEEKRAEPTIDIWSTCPLDPVQDPKVEGIGSRVESETVPQRKQHRISLAELLIKRRPDDEIRELPEKTVAKTGRRSKATGGLVEKILKRSRIGSSKSSRYTDNVPTDNKFHKLFHMFNRKVHPSELCTTTKKYSTGEDTKSHVAGDMLDERENFIHVDPVTGKQKIPAHKGPQIAPAFRLCGSDSNSNRECWIKTDADYLVLEL